jgi:Zn-dependent protease with chaperone function
MQLILLALALGILVYDGLVPAADQAPLLDAPAMLAAVVAPKVAVGVLYLLACIHVRRRLKTPAGPRLLRWLDRATSGYGYLSLVLYGIDLYLGWLPLIRQTIGDLVLIDELLAMLPTLALLVWAWWAYYPIDARLREAGLIARVDSGLPVYPIWTRAQYLVAQLRHQVAIIFVPLMVILGWIEAVGFLFREEHVAGWSMDPRPIVALAGAGGVFLFAPVMLRHVWDTVPLPPGELREMLMGLCRRHGVRVRELLLWRTFGGMINAAVMGLLAPLRYILLSDALLDMLTRRQVQAVMAHELAHVRRGHMVWLLATAIVTIGLLETAVHAAMKTALADAIAATGGPTWLTHPQASYGIAMGAAVLGWALVFGWVSRRIERQADTFAVQSLAAERHERAGGDPDTPPTLDAESVAAMVSALQQVAQLNHVPTDRRSWRHGSIRWRQDYLRSLVGIRADEASIDRVVGRIKLATLAGALVLVALAMTLPPDLRPALLLGV